MNGQLFIVVAALVAIVAVLLWAVVDHLRTVDEPADSLPFVHGHRAPGRWSR